MFFYQLFTRIYFLLIKIASYFKLNSKARKMIEGRKFGKQKLLSQIKRNEKYVWVHCASLGEFEQGRPLIEKIKKETSYKIVLSFFSSSGYEIRKNYEHADIICYLPFDTQKNASDFINTINPKFAIFVKYEIWYYMLKTLSQRKIPSYLISGIQYLSSLKSFSHIFLQNGLSEEILKKNGITETSVFGDTRADRVFMAAKEDFENEYLLRFSKERPTIVCGSTWAKDESLLSCIPQNNLPWNLIVAPHEIEEHHLCEIESKFGHGAVRLSKIKNTDPKLVKTIIVDSIGILSKLYRFGRIAYIGGGFGKGIHNTLEAAAYGIPIFFGPNYKKFNEAIDLINIEAAFCIQSSLELQSLIVKIFSDDKLAEKIAHNAYAYIQKSLGATDLIFERIFLK